MDLPTQWLSVSLMVAMLASLALVLQTWRLPAFPGRNSFVLLLLAVAWWTFSAAMEHGSEQPETKVWWAEMAWLAIASTPGCWALFIWNYIHGRYRPAPRAFYFALLLVAASVWGLALTNDSHHLIYATTIPVGVQPFMSINYFHGPLYFTLAAIYYPLMLLCEMVIFHGIIHSSPVYRAHYIGFAISSLLPWFFNVSYFAGIFQIVPFDLTPFSFAIMNIIFYWMISRQQLFDLLPIAHSRLLDAIPDPVLVLDGDMRIAECNPAARHLAGGQALVGQTLDVFPELREGLNHATDPVLGCHEIAIGDPPRYFDIGEVSLPYAGRHVGRLVLLRDISHRKETEIRLHAAMTELQRQLQSNLLLQQKLREESIRDILTGLHNRRFLDELGPVLLAEADRSEAPLAAVMIDIDHFKRLNDGFGHQAGDTVLRAFGAFLRQNLRQSDAVFRMGGEEFLVLLPHTQDHQALARMDAWRSAVMALTFLHDGLSLTATVSAGLAMYPADADTLFELLHRADLALYQAKVGGRNRVSRWRSDPAPSLGMGEECPNAG